MKLGERLKELRLNEELTQHEMASFVGIHDAAISRYERGRYHPPFDILRSYARVFRISLSELLKGVE